MNKWSKCKKESCGCRREEDEKNNYSEILCCLDLQAPKDPLTILIEKEEEEE